METLSKSQEKIANAVQETAYRLHGVVCSTVSNRGQRQKRVVAQYDSRKGEIMRRVHTFPIDISVAEMYSRIPSMLITSNSLCKG